MRRVGAALIGLAILAVTVVPRGSLPPQAWTLCLICGDRGLADALLNLVLFLPLGVALGALPGARYRAVLIAALFSGSIEVAQIFVPGRDPSPGDVLFNTIGAGIGAELARSARWWLRPGPALAGRLTLGAAGMAGLVLVATGDLLRPDLPRTTYWGQWTPALGHLEWYRGRVIQASLGPLSLPSWRLEQSDRVRELIEQGARLTVRAVAGPRTDRVASLVSIADDRQREILLVGPDRDDLVLRFRTRASRFRLDGPDVRFLNATRGLTPGDTLNVAAWRNGWQYCLGLNQAERCGLGYTVAKGWSLLLYPEGFPAWLKSALDYFWVAGLVLPVGFWARFRSPAVLAGPLVVGLVLAVPLWAGLRPTPPGVALAAAVGIGVGALARAVVHRLTIRAAPR